MNTQPAGAVLEHERIIDAPKSAPDAVPAGMVLMQQDAGPRALPAEQRTQPSDLLAVIARVSSDPNVDMAKVERLYAMHKDMLAMQAEAAFNAAMAQAQNKILPVIKNAYNTQTTSQYAKLDAINEAVMPIITAEGLSISFDTRSGAPAGMLRTVAIVAHAAGHKREYQYDLPLDGTGIKGNANKTELHAIGSTSSYARRYLVCLIFNVATADDTDGQIRTTGKAEPILSEQDKADKAKLEACASMNSLKTLWKSLPDDTRKRLNDVFGECKKKIEDADRKAAQS